jgi:hypothetical protein
MKLDPYRSQHQADVYGGNDDRALSRTSWSRVRM